MKDNLQNNTRKGGCIFSLIKLTILIIIILGVTLYFCLGFIGDYALKTVTSGTEITAGVGKIKVKPIDESVEITDFYLNNPAKKYNKETAVAFKRAFVKVDLGMDLITKNLVVVDEITIDGLNVNIEYSSNSLTSTNLNDITAIIEKKLGLDKKQQPAQVKQPEPTTQEEEKEPMKFIIKKLVFKNGHASSSVLKNVVELPLPDFDIENIGVEQGGKTIGEIIAYVLPRITAQATEQIINNGWKGTLKLGGEASDGIKDAAKDIEKSAKKTFKELKNLFKQN